MQKITGLARKIILSNFRDLTIPYKLTYIITNKCQLKCSICNIWNNPPKNELTLDEIDGFFRKSNDFSWINLSGGEVFLREDFFDIVGAIYRSCRNLYLLDFPTNGFLTNRIKKTVEKILNSYKIPAVFVTVSLDGPPELHDRIRGVAGSWEKAVETFSLLKEIQKRSFKVFFGMTLQNKNMNSFEETFAAVKKRIKNVKYDDFHFNIAQYSEHYYGNTQNGPDLSNTKKLWATLEGAARHKNLSLADPVQFLERRYQRLAKVYLDTGKSPVPCQALAGSCFLSPTGVVYPCSIYNKPIGNIRDFGYDIGNLYNAYAAKQTRREITQGRCPNCWTPCEAYQSILANLLRPARKKL